LASVTDRVSIALQYFRPCPTVKTSKVSKYEPVVFLVTAPAGAIKLESIVQVLPFQPAGIRLPKETKGCFPFQLVTTDCAWTFCSNSEHERQAWIMAIEVQCARSRIQAPGADMMESRSRANSANGSSAHSSANPDAAAAEPEPELGSDALVSVPPSSRPGADGNSGNGRSGQLTASTAAGSPGPASTSTSTSPSGTEGQMLGEQQGSSSHSSRSFAGGDALAIQPDSVLERVVAGGGVQLLPPGVSVGGAPPRRVPSGGRRQSLTAGGALKAASHKLLVGTLEKRCGKSSSGGNGRPPTYKWKRCWFEAREHHLMYFNKQTSEKMLDCIDLHQSDEVCLLPGAPGSYTDSRELRISYQPPGQKGKKSGSSKSKQRGPQVGTTATYVDTTRILLNLPACLPTYLPSCLPTFLPSYLPGARAARRVGTGGETVGGQPEAAAGGVRRGGRLNARGPEQHDRRRGRRRRVHTHEHARAARAVERGPAQEGRRHQLRRAEELEEEALRLGHPAGRAALQVPTPYYYYYYYCY
jgi:hypothetical protein